MTLVSDKQDIFINSIFDFASLTPIDDADESKNIFSKQILPYGEISHPQNPSVKVNFTDEIFDNIIKAFGDNVIETVAILSGTHNDKELERSVGVVTSLVKKEMGLYAIIEILDQNILDMIKTEISDGTSLLSGVSAKLVSTYSTQGIFYENVLVHVALTHQPHITGMEDFIQLFKKNNSKDYFYLGDYAKSLDEQSYIIRMAFYKKYPYRYEYNYNLYVKDVYNEFIIVESDKGLLRYYYNIDEDNAIEFDEPENVEIVYTVVKETSMSVNAEEVLEYLKENGHKDLDSLDSLVIKSDDNKDDIAAIKASNDELENEKVELGKANAELIQRVTQIEENNKHMKAEKEVDSFINLGKIVKSARDSYLELYKTSPDIFDKVMESQPVIVDTKELGMDATLSKDSNDFELSNEKVTEEIERLSKIRRN